MRKVKLTEKDVKNFVVRLKDDERSKNTIKKYVRDLRKLITFLDGRRLDKELMLEFKQSLIETHEPTGVNSILAAISTFLKYNGLEFLKVKKLKCQRKIFCPEEKELSKAEYSRLVKIAERKGKWRLSMIMQTMCSTGIRISELEFFTVEAIRKGRIEVTNKGKTRTIFITSKLRKLLGRYCQRSGIECGIIFRTRTGKCVDRKTVWEEMKELCEDADVSATKVFPHNLRHLFARTYYKIKKDIARLSDILGHSSIESTRIYLVSTGLEHERDLDKMQLILSYQT